ncbi:MAG: cupin domain-containing protein [Clostridia bacterium]|nr:cupin domain-containing protein [Clostridia bacterium]
MEKDFITPPDHVNFKAKKLFGNMGEIIDGAIAYVSAKGGGPMQLHTHSHDHLFIVVKGRARVYVGGREVVLDKDESYLVDGTLPHSVWNDVEEETVMIGLSVKHTETR